LTGWEIYPDSWKAVRKYALTNPRYAHSSVGIANKYIYTFGGKEETASKTIERYKLDGASEAISQLNFPRYYASAWEFDNKYIYVYGGYSFVTNQLLNKIERIDHLHPDVSPSLYELDASEIPSLTGSIIRQYDENTLMILGGKSRKFSKQVYFFNLDEISVKSQDLSIKNLDAPKNIYYYQSDCIILNNEDWKDRSIYYVDWLNNDYSMMNLII
jgi:hypothetical protein